MEREELKSLFNKPQGGIDKMGFAFPHFVAECVFDATTCEICGTEFPELDESNVYPYEIGKLLGRTIVLQCCGKIIDDLYEERGSDFAVAKLDEMSENPFAERNLILYACERIRTGKERIKAASKEIKEAASGANI